MPRPKRISLLSPSEWKQSLNNLWLAVLAYRRTAEAIVFSSAAIFLAGSVVAPALPARWHRQPNSFTPTNTTTVLVERAVVVEPETSAIRLEPILSNSQTRLP